MKKHWQICLLIAIVLALVAPSYGNYREDFLYFGQYQFVRSVLVVNPQLSLLAPMASVLSTSMRHRMYAASDMPEWDFDILAGAGLIDVDRQGIGVNTFEADAFTLHTGVVARHGRWTLRGTAHREDIEGKGANGAGLDNKNTGLVLMPGYRVLTQEENFINLDVDAILDASYATFTGSFTSNASGWYVRPGAKVTASHLCTGGLVQLAYAYNQLRSIDGDKDQFTGNKSVDSHAVALDYACLFTKEFWGNIGISHIKMGDMPTGANTGIDEKLTDVHLGLGVEVPGRVTINGGYFRAIDGRGTDGFNLQGMWRFK